MYGIERYLQEMKQDVRNKARPEGSMAEGYQAKECITFIARFLKRSSTTTCEVNECSTSQSIFPKVGHPIKGKGRTAKKKNRGHIIDRITWAQAHRYVLFNCDSEEVEKYISEHKICVSTKRKRKWDSAQDHSKDFIDWFKEKVDLILEEGRDIIPNHILWLSKGPSRVAKKYTGYSINGYRFHTMKRDANCVTQNSGVTLTAMTHSFSSSKDKNPTMKANRPRFSTSQSHVTDYELQRLQKLKFNAERMIAQGSGSLANKILQDKMKTVLSLGAAQNDTAEDIDDDSGSDDACENEGETANSMEVDNLTSRKRKVCTQVNDQLNEDEV